MRLYCEKVGQLTLNTLFLRSEIWHIYLVSLIDVTMENSQKKSRRRETEPHPPPRGDNNGDPNSKDYFTPALLVGLSEHQLQSSSTTNNQLNLISSKC